MKFFQNRGVAILICILMIVAALGIGQMKQPEFVPENESLAENWGENNYSSYLRFISDETGVLEDRTIEELSVMNASLDYSYESICGLVLVNGVDSNSMEDAAFDAGERLGLGEKDAVLLLNLQHEDWYFACGTEMEPYLDHELEILATSYMDEVFSDPNDTLSGLFEELSVWYKNHLPVSGQEDSDMSFGMIAGGIVIFVLLITILVVASVISAICRAGRRFSTGFRRYVPLIFTGRRNPHRGYRPGPRPGAGPRSRPSYRPSSGVKSSSCPQNRNIGGFGGNNRGNFSRGGGFGSSSRGGGFGKK